MPLASWSRAWRRGGWIRRLSGTTCSPLMAQLGVDTWMLSLPVSPASRGAPPAKATASQTNGGSGPTFGTVFASWDQGSSSWRTCRPSLLEGASDSYSETWPISGSMRSGTCFAQPTSVPPIVARGCSFWPTTSEADARSSGRHTTTTGVMHPGTSLTDAMRQWPTPLGSDSEQRGHNGTKKAGRVLSVEAHLWATPLKRDYRSGLGTQKRVGTPALNEQVALWPTPTAMDSEQAGGKGATGTTRGPSLHRAMDDWPTPTAEPYGSSQNGINGVGGTHERPSANTPSLERLSRSFLPGLLTETDGDASWPSDPTSRQPSLWKTPHGFANTDQYGRTGGGGGEFHKQAMAAAENLWPTPRAQEDGSSLEAQQSRIRKLDAKSTTGGPHHKPTGLTQAVEQSTGVKAKLNPQFVEWLMGLPIGWTGSEACGNGVVPLAVAYAFVTLATRAGLIVIAPQIQETVS